MALLGDWFSIGNFGRFLSFETLESFFTGTGTTEPKRSYREPPPLAIDIEAAKTEEQIKAIVSQITTDSTFSTLRDCLAKASENRFEHSFKVVKTEIDGTDQDTADYLLKSVSQIDTLVQELFRKIKQLKDAAPDRSEAIASNVQEDALNALNTQLSSCIPHLVALLTPQKEDLLDTTYIDDRYQAVEATERSIPNIYDLPLSLLERETVQIAPIGLENRGANCWAIALLQFLIHIPHFRKNLLDALPSELQPLQIFIAQYFLDQGCKRAISRMNPLGLRLFLHQQFRIVEASIHSNADAVEAMSRLATEIKDSELHFSLQHTKMYASSHSPIISKEKSVKLDIPIPNISIAIFEDILIDAMRNEYCHLIDEPGSSGPPTKDTLLFLEPPPQLTVAFNRFRYEGSIKKKVLTKLDIPFKFILPAALTLDGRFAIYELQGFIVHISNSSTDSGHYITCIQKNKKWYLCNDEVILEINSEKAINLARDAYLITYKREEFLTKEDASLLIEARIALRTPLKADDKHDSLPARQQAEYLIKLSKQFLEKPTKENFECFPVTIQKQLAFIKAIEDGCPDNLAHGMLSLHSAPASLLRIDKRYFSLQGTNVIDQLLHRNILLFGNPKAAQEEESPLEDCWKAETPAFSAEQLETLHSFLSTPHKA